MTIQERLELFAAFLKDEGYNCELREKTKSIVVEYEGQDFCIYFTETDETFILIEYPYFLEINSQEEKTKALDIANYLNCESKGKIILREDDDEMGMSVEIGCFFKDGNDFKLFYKNFFSILLSMADEFVSEMG